MAKSYNLLVFEEAVNPAPGERRQRRSPCARIRTTAADVAWDIIPWEEVDINGFTSPFCGVDSTAIRVEACSVRLSICCNDLTSGIRGLTRGVHVAVRSRYGTREHAIVRYTAAWPSVQCHGVRGLRIHSFDDVDLPIQWPIGPK